MIYGSWVIRGEVRSANKYVLFVVPGLILAWILFNGYYENLLVEYEYIC